jgi:hypothetical protein
MQAHLRQRIVARAAQFKPDGLYEKRLLFGTSSAFDFSGPQNWPSQSETGICVAIIWLNSNSSSSRSIDVVVRYS